MSHVFTGEPDARQSSDVDMQTSRFRPRYRALTDEQKSLHDAIKAKAVELEALVFVGPLTCTGVPPTPLDVWMVATWAAV